MDKYIPVSINVPMQDLLAWISAAGLTIKNQRDFDILVSTDKFRRDLAANLLQAWDLMNTDESDQLDNVTALIPDKYFEDYTG